MKFCDRPMQLRSLRQRLAIFAVTILSWIQLAGPEPATCGKEA